MLFKGQKRVFNFFKWCDLEIYEKVILDTKDILFAQFSLFVSLLIIFLSVSFFFYVDQNGNVLYQLPTVRRAASRIKFDPGIALRRNQCDVKFLNVGYKKTRREHSGFLY